MKSESRLRECGRYGAVYEARRLGGHLGSLGLHPCWDGGARWWLRRQRRSRCASVGVSRIVRTPKCLSRASDDKTETLSQRPPYPACCAATTSFSAAPASRQRRSKIARWSGPGPTMRALGRSESSRTKANTSSTVDGLAKTRQFITARTSPDNTMTEMENGSGIFARRMSHCAY